jgi:hypothetical protein
MEPNTMIDAIRNAGGEEAALLIGFYFIYKIGAAILPRLRRPSRTASAWIICLLLILCVIAVIVVVAWPPRFASGKPSTMREVNLSHVMSPPAPRIRFAEDQRRHFLRMRI